jgi:hypothetical protein
MFVVVLMMVVVMMVVMMRVHECNWRLPAGDQWKGKEKGELHMHTYMCVHTHTHRYNEANIMKPTKHCLKGGRRRGE